MASYVRYEKQEHVAVITLDRPEVHNAINPSMGRELVAAWQAFRDDPELWVAIVTGAGEQAFSAGADLKSLGEMQATATPWQLFTAADREPDFAAITRNLDVWKPKIAAINGYCFGAGLELALACEIRLASESAVFALPETGWGMIPGGGGTQRLPRLVPPGLAFEMILSGRRLDAREAARAGLVNDVAADRAALLQKAQALADEMCQRAPLALQAATQLIWQARELPLADGLRMEAAFANLLRSTEDAREGPAAFREKRPPQFKGK